MVRDMAPVCWEFWSVPGQAEDRDGRVAPADFGSNKVVDPNDARDDRHVLDTASAVSDHPAAGRTTQLAPQQHLARSGIQHQEVSGQFTGEDQVTRGRGNACYQRLRGVVTPPLTSGRCVKGSEPSPRR